MLIFIHGTFFEIMVCFSVTVLMLKNYDWLGGADKVSLLVGIFFALLRLGYLALVFYFILTKAKLIVQKTQGELAEENQGKIKDVHEDVLSSRRISISAP